ncbi:hypothetical protein Tco_0798820 [Tanacetum coccineum]
MVATRSTDNGGNNQRGRVNSGEGPSQKRETFGGQRGGNNGGAYGRLTKVEFPKFDGEDVQGWLYRVNK